MHSYNSRIILSLNKMNFQTVNQITTKKDNYK